MSPRLICLGDTVIDVTVFVDALPESGGDVIAHSGAMLAGGSGFNVMAAASRLGLPAVYGGVHGVGPFGDLARAAMLREHITLVHEADTEADTGWDVAVTEATSERSFMTVIGAEARLTSAKIARVTAAPGDAVYLSGYGLLSEPNRSAIVQWLAALPADIIVVADPGPLVADIPPETLKAVFASTTWWSCNHSEATTMTGEADPHAAARSLAARGPQIVVRLGADGCIVATSSQDSVAVAGFPVDAVDSNGAGDAHVGAFTAALVAGVEPHTAARRANAAAASAVTRVGPATGPTSEQLDRFLAT